MAKHAHYHLHGQAPRLLEVLKENPDGTLDLGEGGQVLIAGCPQGANVGCCSIAAAPAAADKAKADAEAEAKAKADPEAKAKADKK